MNTIVRQQSTHASPLEHRLKEHFSELARFHSTRALEDSPLYARLRAEVERVLNGVECGAFEPRSESRESLGDARTIRATAWNIERGLRLDGIIRVLAEHTLMSRSDVLLLTELDYGMARSGNRHVAREIAEG
ncbi:MAG: hypothetical protein DMF65_01430, partial [Acidobacteria bacterium]